MTKRMKISTIVATVVLLGECRFATISGLIAPLFKGDIKTVSQSR